jgi:hypothetical protein
MSLPDETPLPTEATSATLTVARLLSHMKKPENLLTWLVLTAWMKWMGVAQHLPTITLG